MSGRASVRRTLRQRASVTWMDAAECQGSRIDFVSDNPLETYLAQQVCRRCPVAADCLDYALTRREMRGVWGGLTDEQRRHLAGAR